MAKKPELKCCEGCGRDTWTVRERGVYCYRCLVGDYFDSRVPVETDAMRRSDLADVEYRCRINRAPQGAVRKSV